MKSVKDELQHIILGDGQTGSSSHLKTAQSFLRRFAEASSPAEKQQRFKEQETTTLIAFAEREGLLYGFPIPVNNFVGEGAEQQVYELDGDYVLKTNSGIFYKSWLDYFNSLLIHNFFFPDYGIHFSRF